MKSQRLESKSRIQIEMKPALLIQLASAVSELHLPKSLKSPAEIGTGLLKNLIEIAKSALEPDPENRITIFISVERMTLQEDIGKRQAKFKVRCLSHTDEPVETYSPMLVTSQLVQKLVDQHLF